MTLSHHSSNDNDLNRRFIDELMGRARREFPDGRIGPDDDGSLTFAIANDDRHRKIIIRFSKPCEWVGLSVADAEALIDNLNERVMALRGIRADN